MSPVQRSVDASGPGDTTLGSSTATGGRPPRVGDRDGQAADQRAVDARDRVGAPQPCDTGPRLSHPALEQPAAYEVPASGMRVAATAAADTMAVFTRRRSSRRHPSDPFAGLAFRPASTPPPANPEASVRPPCDHQHSGHGKGRPLIRGGCAIAHTAWSPTDPQRADSVLPSGTRCRKAAWTDPRTAAAGMAARQYGQARVPDGPCRSAARPHRGP